MNAGHTSERIYAALRARILDHAYRPGDRLDPGLLAEELASSVTPVRDALHRLTGEGLAETRTSEGFHIPAIDEPALKDLLSWSRELLLLALRAWPEGVAFPRVDMPDAARLANATGDLFGEIAGGSPNVEHKKASAAAQARLNPARRVEMLVLGGLAEEFAQLSTLVVQANRKELRRALDEYFRRRSRRASEIVRLLYRV